jgi:hypothetical protein
LTKILRAYNLVLFLDCTGNAFSFFPLSIMLAIGLLDIAFMIFLFLVSSGLFILSWRDV